jgi:uncharacterized protein YcnI
VERGLAVGVAALLVVLVATPAGAHVTVSPTRATRGSFTVLTFSVPNEKTNANTTAVQIGFPTERPIAAVSYQPMPGWSTTVARTKLAKPLSTDDGDVNEVVSSITWTATGAGLAPGQFELFTVAAGPLPNVKRLAFPAVQTYSDGDVVRWIETPTKGASELEHPAPVLRVTRRPR